MGVSGTWRDFEISKSHVKISLAYCLSYDYGSYVNSQILHQHQAFLCAIMLTAMMAMDELSETINKTPIKYFLL